MDEYLYHGTSSVYIPYLLQNGLSGEYPDNVYKKLLRLWKWMRRQEIPWDLDITLQELDYIEKFFNRRDFIQISLTTRLDTAQEYINSDRIGGEGISFLLSVFVKNWEKIKIHDLYPKTIDDLKFILNFFSRQTGIILAFKKNDLISLLPKECSSPTNILKNTDVPEGMTSIKRIRVITCLTQSQFNSQCYKKQDEIFFDQPIPADFIYVYQNILTPPIKLSSKKIIISPGVTNQDLSIILEEIHDIERHDIEIHDIETHDLKMRNVTSPIPQNIGLPIPQNIIIGGTRKKNI